MRVLLISHTYVVAENQKKLQAIATRPGIELAVVTPHLWREPLLRESKTHLPIGAPFAFRPIRATWAGKEQFYWYWSLDLGMRHFKPDVLYVEQGAGSFVYAQSLIARNVFAPRARAAFFTWWNLPYRARWPLREVERFNLSQTQGAVVGNQDAADIVRDHGFKGPLVVLPQLGVDPEEFQRREVSDLRQELGLERFTVGYVGRFVEEKGVRVLLAALAGADFDFQLLMVGRGPLESEIRAFAQARGWGDRLKIVSGVNQTEVGRYQNCMDVMVVPSLTCPFWKEQFGHVIIEAMACEAPVIGSDSAEVPFVIGDAGLVTPEGDAASLRAALARLAASPEERRRLGRAGRQRVLDEYTHHKIAQRLVEFLQSLPPR